MAKRDDESLSKGILRRKYSIFFNKVDHSKIESYRSILNILDSYPQRFSEVICSRKHLEESIIMDDKNIYVRTDIGFPFIDGEEDYYQWVSVGMPLLDIPDRAYFNDEIDPLFHLGLEAMFPYLALRMDPRLINIMHILNKHESDAKYILDGDIAKLFFEETSFSPTYFTSMQYYALTIGECMVLALSEDKLFAFEVLYDYFFFFEFPRRQFFLDAFEGHIEQILLYFIYEDSNLQRLKVTKGIDISKLITKYSYVFRDFRNRIDQKIDILVSKLSKKQTYDLLILAAENGLGVIYHSIMKSKQVEDWETQDFEYVLTAALIGGIGSRDLVLQLLEDERVDLKYENALGGEVYYHILQLPSNYRNQLLDIILDRPDVNRDDLMIVLGIFPNREVVEQVRQYIG